MSNEGFQQAILVAAGDVVKVRRRFDGIQQTLTPAVRLAELAVPHVAQERAP